ncbi:hypothetical protein EDD21DRAFT_387238 [Dissophora ornata]|nr:hypothetical protein EDD21DRAFT_387238 [Dissophora ornata]
MLTKKKRTPKIRSFFLFLFVDFAPSCRLFITRRKNFTSRETERRCNLTPLPLPQYYCSYHVEKNLSIGEHVLQTSKTGLQRRATERVVGAGGGRARRGTDPERPMLEHSASFNSGLDGPARRGPGGMGGAGHGPSSLGPAGSEPRMSLLSRRNTDAQRPAPLNLNGNSNYGAGGPASAAPAIVAPVPRSQYQDELDDLEKHVYALSLESQGSRVGTGSPNLSSTDLRASPVPTRSNSNRPGILRKASQSSMGVSSPLSTVNGQAPPMPNNNNYNNYNKGNNGYNHNNYDSNPPSRTGTPPVLSELRRSGSNNSTKMGGLSREDSVRSVTSGGSGGSMGNINGGIYQQPNGNHSGYLNGAEGSYLDEPVYAGLRDKLRVKCHYMDTRAVLVRPDTPLHELIQKIQDKFQADRPLKLKYKDEDHHMLSMVDDEDWLMAQQVHMEATGSLDRMELWCFEDE